MTITPSHIAACLALLAARRRTSGYADLDDLRMAAGIGVRDLSTQEGAAAKSIEDVALVEAMLCRRNVFVDRRDSNGTRFSLRT